MTPSAGQPFEPNGMTAMVGMGFPGNRVTRRVARKFSKFDSGRKAELSRAFAEEQITAAIQRSYE